MSVTRVEKTSVVDVGVVEGSSDAGLLLLMLLGLAGLLRRRMGVGKRLAVEHTAPSMKTSLLIKSALMGAFLFLGSLSIYEGQIPDLAWWIKTPLLGLNARSNRSSARRMDV